jgi:hypothetical protein
MTKILDNQSIFDVVLQESGGINNAARVLRDNGLNFNDSLVAGADLSVGVLESEKIKENYDLIQFRPNNAELTIIEEWILEGGVWNDFGTWIDTELWQDS